MDIHLINNIFKVIYIILFFGLSSIWLYIVLDSFLNLSFCMNKYLIKRILKKKGHTIIFNSYNYYGYTTFICTSCGEKFIVDPYSSLKLKEQKKNLKSSLSCNECKIKDILE
jgi:hypothetical protein